MFGAAKAERIALNDDTLWSGMPRDWNNAPPQRSICRSCASWCWWTRTTRPADDECHKMEGPWNQNYLPVGDLLIEMDHPENVGVVQENAGPRYGGGQGGVQRLWGALHARGVCLVSRRCDRDANYASQPGTVSATLRMKSLLRSSSSAQGTSLLLTGKAPKQSLPGYVSTEPAVVYSDVDGEGMHFASVVHVEASGGKTEPQPGWQCAGRRGDVGGNEGRVRDWVSRVCRDARSPAEAGCGEGHARRGTSGASLL